MITRWVSGITAGWFCMLAMLTATELVGAQEDGASARATESPSKRLIVVTGAGLLPPA